MNYDALPWEILALWAYFTAVWALSVRLRDAGIVDIAWGPGYILVALVNFLIVEPHWRGTLVLALTAIWGGRLALHIWIRHRGKPEDARYRNFRENGGPNWAWTSYFKVFLLQGAILWVVARPLVIAINAPAAGWTIWDSLGVALWTVGFLFEAVGDYQLLRFLRRAQRPAFLATGLWRYTRHPNYFGEAALWWGFGLFGVASGAAWTLIAPVIMTWLLRFFSGVPMLERLMMRKPGYAAYAARTNAFIPWFPKANPEDGR